MNFFETIGIGLVILCGVAAIGVFETHSLLTSIIAFVVGASVPLLSYYMLGLLFDRISKRKHTK